MTYSSFSNTKQNKPNKMREKSKTRSRHTYISWPTFVGSSRFHVSLRKKKVVSNKFEDVRDKTHTPEKY